MAKILIVDDEQIILSMYAKKFENASHVVSTALDGEQGLEIALRDKPDLILLDINMPKMDGMAMMHEIRKDKGWGESVPIIMLTNVDAPDEQIKEGAASDHPVYYIVKSNTRPEKVLDKATEVLDFIKDESTIL